MTNKTDKTRTVMGPAPRSSISRAGRRVIKRLMYSQLSLLDAPRILLGRSEPTIRFRIEAEPASVYWNFTVRDDRLEDFIEYIALPAQFEVSPVRCLAGEEPRHTLTLNVYAVSGLVSGMRAEWSTYVIDQFGKPRYMVLEALSSSMSLDPDNLITRESTVEHRSGRTVATLVDNHEGGRFTSHYQPTAAPEQGVLDREWLEANDYIYWRGGICDRAFYDASLANPSVILVAPATVELANSTAWAPFLEPVPRQVIQFAHALELIILPWENI